MAPERPDDTVQHQDAHEAIIDSRVAEALDGQDTENVAIDDLVEITGGQHPTEEEHNLLVTTINDILAALRSSHIIPESD